MHYNAPMNTGSIWDALEWYGQLALDLILPPHERTLRTRDRRLEDIPLTPASHYLLRTRIITIMNYQRPAVRDLVQSLKYDGHARASELCASIVADYLCEEIAQLHAFSPRPIVLIP